MKEMLKKVLLLVLMISVIGLISCDDDYGGGESKKYAYVDFGNYSDISLNGIRLGEAEYTGVLWSGDDTYGYWNEYYGCKVEAGSYRVEIQHQDESWFKASGAAFKLKKNHCYDVDCGILEDGTLVFCLYDWGLKDDLVAAIESDQEDYEHPGYILYVNAIEEVFEGRSVRGMRNNVKTENRLENIDKYENKRKKVLK